MSNEQTLANNCLKQFILRIDFSGVFPCNEIAENIKDLFVRREERKVRGYRMRFNPAQGDVMPVMEQGEVLENIFVKVDGGTLTLSPIDSSLIINTNHYVDNSAYLEILNKVVSAHWNARRIGLRYINMFDCERPATVGRIFNPPYSAIVKQLIVGETVSRAVSVQSRTSDDGNISKIQFGVANSFFPKRISRCDLLLDIDAYHVGEVTSDESMGLVKQLNHDAFAVFREFITERQIGAMK